MDTHLSDLITQSFPRLFGELEQTAPELRPPLEAWMRALAGGHDPEAYFKHPMAFPTLLLPWWVEQSLGHTPSPALQFDIAYSSINGYYFIRMIDNVMDDDSPVEKKLLPALAFFHTEFQTAYQAHFPPAHPFWGLYRSVWFGTAQAAVGDARLETIDLPAFERLSAQKVSAAMIPVAAICHHHNRPDLLEPWLEFVQRIGKWHQMFNDIFDWHKDSQNGSQTYFLSEASRLKQPEETAFAFIIREGFALGCDQMRAWMRDCQSLATTLNCPDLVTYLDERAALFEVRAQSSLDGLETLGKLAKLAV
jgi:hypothetical protein